MYAMTSENIRIDEKSLSGPPWRCTRMVVREAMDDGQETVAARERRGRQCVYGYAVE